jgi:ribosome-binding factor A
MQRALAELLQRSVKDPRVGKVTVTAMQLAADLSVARVQVLPFGGMQAAEAAGSEAPGPAATAMLQGLRSAAGFLRGQLARELQLRAAPRLEFELDRHLLQAHRLTELIDHVLADDEGRSAHSDTGHHGGNKAG